MIPSPAWILFPRKLTSQDLAHATRTQIIHYLSQVDPRSFHDLLGGKVTRGGGEIIIKLGLGVNIKTKYGSDIINTTKDSTVLMAIFFSVLLPKAPFREKMALTTNTERNIKVTGIIPSRWK